MRLTLFIIALALAGSGLYWIHRDNARIDAEFCQEIEQNETFDPDTVDRLWNWRHGHEGHPSQKFCELYDKKVKKFPGRR